MNQCFGALKATLFELLTGDEIFAEQPTLTDAGTLSLQFSSKPGVVGAATITLSNGKGAPRMEIDASLENEWDPRLDGIADYDLVASILL